MEDGTAGVRSRDYRIFVTFKRSLLPFLCSSPHKDSSSRRCPYPLGLLWAQDLPPVVIVDSQGKGALLRPASRGLVSSHPSYRVV